MRKSRRRRSTAATLNVIEPIVQLWILRLLIPLECRRQFLDSHGYANDELAGLLGLVSDTDEEQDYDAGQAFIQLRRCHEAAEQTADQCFLPQPLADNIERLTQQIGMNSVESQILAFAVLMHTNRLLSDVCNWLGVELNTLKLYHALAVILGLPETNVREALSMRAMLAQTSLVTVGGHRHCGLSSMLDVLSGQSFFHHIPCLIAFDEFEDVFNDGNALFGMKSTAQTRKAWMNRLLEENPVPTIWLGNSLDRIDPAFVRRFDWVIEMPIPPRDQREQIIRRECGRVISEQAIKRLASSEELAPAVVTRAMKVIGTLQNRFTNDQLSNVLERLMDNTLIAQGHQGLGSNKALGLPDNYDPELINCDANVKQIARGIQQYGSARLCLYGPPSTGKSAYALWLAEQLNRPLHVKRGSDLLSMWVGGTEKNIAKVFDNAEQDGAVLLIDEVDSFLQDRGTSANGWEITAVNEMLIRMEHFNGVLIASTNRINGLDVAALRRFDLKLKFDVLKPDQVWCLFRKYCDGLGFAEPATSMQHQLQQLEGLTVGDFAVLARQHRFSPIQTATAMLDALQAEWALKAHRTSRPIGFI